MNYELKRIINSKIKKEIDMNFLKRLLLNFYFFKQIFKTLNNVKFNFLLNSLKIDYYKNNQIILNYKENSNKFLITLVHLLIFVPSNKYDKNNNINKEIINIFNILNKYNQIPDIKNELKKILNNFYLLKILNPGESIGEFCLIYNKNSPYLIINTYPGNILYIDKEIFNLTIKNYTIKKLENFFQYFRYLKLIKKKDYLNKYINLLFFYLKKKKKKKNNKFKNEKTNLYFIIDGKIMLKNSKLKKIKIIKNKKFIISDSFFLKNNDIINCEIKTVSKVNYYKLNIEWINNSKVFINNFLINNLAKLDIKYTCNDLNINIKKKIKLISQKNIKMDEKEIEFKMISRDEIFQSENKLLKCIKELDKKFFLKKKKLTNNLNDNKKLNKTNKRYTINNIKNNKSQNILIQNNEVKNKYFFINNNLKSRKNKNMNNIISILFKNKSINNNNFIRKNKKIKKKKFNYVKVKKINVIKNNKSNFKIDLNN